MVFGVIMVIGKNMVFDENLISGENMFFGDTMIFCENMVFGENMSFGKNIVFSGKQGLLVFKDGDFSHKLYYFGNFLKILNLEGHPNYITATGSGDFD